MAPEEAASTSSSSGSSDSGNSSDSDGEDGGSRDGPDSGEDVPEAPESEDEEPADPEVQTEARAEDGDPADYPDDDLESEPEVRVQTRTAIMKERAAKRAASSAFLTQSWAVSGMPSDDAAGRSPESPRSPGRDMDWEEGVDSFSPQRTAREPSDLEPSPRRKPSWCGCVSRLRTRWGERCGPCLRRAARCCAPCASLMRLVSRLWVAFEARCKPLAFGVRCLFCPFFLLLAGLRCCCGTGGASEVPRSPSRSKLSRKASTRSMSRGFSRGFSRSGSMAARGSRTLRKSGTLSTRFSEGPSHQPKSTIKATHPRLPRQEEVQKKASARERFRELRREMTHDAGEMDAQQMGGTLDHRQSSLKLQSLKSGVGKSLAKSLQRGESSFSEIPEPTGLAALDWTAWLPWNWASTFEVWKESRIEMWAGLEKVLEEMEKEDQIKCDAEGIRRSTLERKYLRARRTFIFAYWDPFLDILPRWKTVVAVLTGSLLLIPISGFVLASVLLISSILRNMEYVEGNCQIEALPEAFVTSKGVVTEVSGKYLIRRFYAASPDRTEGFVLQACDIRVPCEHEDIALTGFLEREKCDKFRIWAWRDPVVCYYHQDDEYATEGRDLLCLSRPSDLQEEIFGVVIAGAAVLVAVLIIVVLLIRRALEQREAQRFQEEFERELEKQRVEAEEREIEEETRRQKEENQKQADADAEAEVDNVDDLEWATERSKSLLKQPTRLTMSQFNHSRDSGVVSESLALGRSQSRGVMSPPAV